MNFIEHKRRPLARRPVPRPTLALSRAFCLERERKRYEEEWPDLPPSREPWSLLAWLDTPRRVRALACAVVVLFALFVGFQAGRLAGCECRETAGMEATR